MKSNMLLAFVLLFATACNAQPGGGDNLPPVAVKAQQVVGGLQAPTDMVFPGGGTIWVTEQTGKIKIVHNGRVTGVLLDVADKMISINSGYDERGLLGIALHPSFASNKKFYIFYSSPGGGDANNNATVAEYTLLPNSETADVSSARIIIKVPKPQGNHNGGCIKFGPDGYLYIGIGDGGGAGDRHGRIGNGQAIDTWLGKILRVDVNDRQAYKIPADNPFVHTPGAKPEIWAYGLRNPYRFSFNKVNGQLFAGDVGQDAWEEIDVIQKGGNYGWRLMEGTHCYNPSTACPEDGLIMPINEFSHREGVSVIGGFVYNGTALATLKGRYVFGDWSGPLFYLQNVNGRWQKGKLDVQDYPGGLKVTGFGEDGAGELYWLTNEDNGPGDTKGALYKLAVK